MTKILLDAGVEAPYIHKNKGLCFFFGDFFFFAVTVCVVLLGKNTVSFDSLRRNTRCTKISMQKYCPFMSTTLQYIYIYMGDESNEVLFW